MREYDHRFVYRKVFASRVDRGTQTNEGESKACRPKSFVKSPEYLVLVGSALADILAELVW